ncbi:FemAB family XrtA/PEP-CTERM system-associated protein [Pseudopontixanthobacter vadosimaris]|uniref:FemAB family XrtA/PEP-CTERM system-associated protein n=1 Tax=Pseudopontixanthobacter vadosimaris TaxID=2726450 RepID=UPI003B835C1D
MNAPVASFAADALNAGVICSILNCSDAAAASAVDAFVTKQGGTPFHRPRWLRAVERGTGQRAIGLVATRGGDIAGWLPLTEIHSPLFGRALVSSGFAVGGGVLAEDRWVAEVLCRHVQEIARRQSCDSIELRGGFAPDGWRVTSDSHSGFVGELASNDDEQLKAIPRKQRAEVRKSLQIDFDIHTGRSEDDRAMHYAVYAESVRNLGTPVFPRSLFDAVLDEFADSSDILTTSLGGKPVSSVLSLYDGGAVMPYWGGGRHEARSLRANERMYYELMLHARRKGCTRFDFGRSKTGSGPWRYKKNWGFTPEPLTYASWTAPGRTPRDADPTSAAYARKIALWKRLPLGIANRIGPFIARGLG